MYTTQLCMCSLGAKEVAAVDSCFALVRARQHCIGLLEIICSDMSESIVHDCTYMRGHTGP